MLDPKDSPGTRTQTTAPAGSRSLWDAIGSKLAIGLTGLTLLGLPQHDPQTYRQVEPPAAPAPKETDPLLVPNLVDSLNRTLGSIATLERDSLSDEEKVLFDKLAKMKPSYENPVESLLSQRMVLASEAQSLIDKVIDRDIKRLCPNHPIEKEGRRYSIPYKHDTIEFRFDDIGNLAAFQTRGITFRMPAGWNFVGIEEVLDPTLAPTAGLVGHLRENLISSVAIDGIGMHSVECEIPGGTRLAQYKHGLFSVESDFSIKGFNDFHDARDLATKLARDELGLVLSLRSTPGGLLLADQLAAGQSPIALVGQTTDPEVRRILEAIVENRTLESRARTKRDELELAMNGSIVRDVTRPESRFHVYRFQGEDKSDVVFIEQSSKGDVTSLTTVRRDKPLLIQTPAEALSDLYSGKSLDNGFRIHSSSGLEQLFLANVRSVANGQAVTEADHMRKFYACRAVLHYCVNRGIEVGELLTDKSYAAQVIAPKLRTMNEDFDRYIRCGLLIHGEFKTALVAMVESKFLSERLSGASVLARHFPEMAANDKVAACFVEATKPVPKEIDDIDVRIDNLLVSLAGSEVVEYGVLSCTSLKLTPALSAALDESSIMGRKTACRALFECLRRGDERAVDGIAAAILSKRTDKGEMPYGTFIAESAVATLYRHKQEWYRKIVDKVEAASKSPDKEISSHAKLWLRASKLGIFSLSRYSPATLDKVLKEREQPNRDKRPVVTCYFSADDHNGVIRHAGKNVIDEFMKRGYRVIVFDIGRKTEIGRDTEFDERDSGDVFFMLHASHNFADLGATWPGVQRSELELTLSDLPALAKTNLPRRLAKDRIAIYNGCSMGERRDEIRNFGNESRRELFRHAKEKGIYSPTVPVMGYFAVPTFDPDTGLLDGMFWIEADATYQTRGLPGRRKRDDFLVA